MALEKEYGYFLKNKENLLKLFPNKFIVIIDDEVVGNFDSQEKALKKAFKKYTLGTFLIQKVSKDESDTTQRFFSMVYF
ncbi:MAG: DUF5678 domain-containing protein [Candidatus Omnitrophota bacterium]